MGSRAVNKEKRTRNFYGLISPLETTSGMSVGNLSDVNILIRSATETKN